MHENCARSCARNLKFSLHAMPLSQAPSEKHSFHIPSCDFCPPVPRRVESERRVPCVTRIVPAFDSHPHLDTTLLVSRLFVFLILTAVTIERRIEMQTLLFPSVTVRRFFFDWVWFFVTQGRLSYAVVVCESFQVPDNADLRYICKTRSSQRLISSLYHKYISGKSRTCTQAASEWVNTLLFRLSLLKFIDNIIDLEFIRYLSITLIDAIWKLGNRIGINL